MKLLQQRDTRLQQIDTRTHLPNEVLHDGKKYPRCHFFQSYFYNKLYTDKQRYDYQEVSRWTTNARLPAAINHIFEFDMLFIPIHLNGHWNLVVVDLRGGRECFALYDSLYSRETSTNKTILDNIQRYIGDEASAKAGMQLPVSSWPRHYRENIPKQKNGYDCGVFMMRFAEYLSRDHVLAFGQHDIAHFRHRAVVEILRMKV